MYTVIVEVPFHAAHRVELPDGTLEPWHAHDWLVRAHFCRAELDRKEMVIDFQYAQSTMKAVLATLEGTTLNENRALSGRNPTAEVVAEHVLREIRSRGLDMLCRVEVTEAPGCVAIADAS